ncbi:MAG TPA: hypothetical protein VKE69_01825, partial [Planctomycetota bacterium]|nr:hypothetical protein [Planctomycetota bacterium]
MTRAPWVGRALAVAEVLVAFAAMHVAFRAFKRFTTWGHLETEAGMNFSPGVAMVVVAVVAIALRRRGLGKSGLTPRPFFANANAGLASL